jgi:acetyl esterase
MPLDPQAKALMDQLAAANGPKLHSLEPADARRLTAGMFRVPPERAEKVAKVEDRKIPGPAGEFRFESIRPRAVARSRCWFFFTAADG